MAKQNGIDYFTVYTINPERLKLFFPNGDARCAKCHWLFNEHGLNRSRCRLTDEIIDFPNYPGLPEICPFEPTGEVIGHKYKEEKQ